MNKIRRAMETLPGHWYQGGYSENEVPGLKNNIGANMCGLGHLRQAFWEGLENPEEYPSGWLASKEARLMDDVAREQYPERGDADGRLTGFVNFNDHSDTTEEDVLKVMEKAAIKYEEQTGLS